MKVLGVITARGGSKGIPGKNLAPVGGKPLLDYTVAAALASRELDRVILTTDDPRIAARGRLHGIDVPFVRPRQLAGDRTPSAPVIRHAVEWLETHESYRADAVMTLQPTSPFRRAEHIDAAIRLLHRTGADSVLGVAAVREHPYDVVTFAGRRMRFLIPAAARKTRRQDYPGCFVINGAIYLTRRAVLAGRLRYGRRIEKYVMDATASFEIDTSEDLVLAEALLVAMVSANGHGGRHGRAPKGRPVR